MSQILHCSYCAETIRRKEVLGHVEEFHVGHQLKLKDCPIVLCGHCGYQTLEEDRAKMIEHCFRMKHPSKDILLDWGQFMSNELNRIRCVIGSGVELLQDNFADYTLNSRNDDCPDSTNKEDAKEGDQSEKIEDCESILVPLHSPQKSECMDTNNEDGSHNTAHDQEPSNSNSNEERTPTNEIISFEHSAFNDKISLAKSVRKRKRKLPKHLISKYEEPPTEFKYNSSETLNERIEPEENSAAHNSTSNFDGLECKGEIEEKKPNYELSFTGGTDQKIFTILCQSCMLSIRAKSLDRRALVIHAISHTQLKLTRCEDCGIDFRSDIGFTNHKKRVNCTGQGTGLMTDEKRSELKEVLAKCFPEFDFDELLTQSKTFGNSPKHIRRIRYVPLTPKIREQRAGIFDCGKCTLNGVKLRRDAVQHAISHLGLKPYACKWCPAVLSDLRNFRRHAKGKKFESGGCNGEFNVEVESEDILRILDELDQCFPDADWREKLAPGTQCAGITF